jgi:cytochrome-b5 reductase
MLAFASFLPEQLLELARDPLLLVFLGLCAVTFYRKELSTNSEYHDDSDEDTFVLNAETARRAASGVAKAAGEAQAAARSQLEQLYSSTAARLVAPSGRTISPAAASAAAGTARAAAKARAQAAAQALPSLVLLLEVLPPDAVGAVFDFLDHCDVLCAAAASRALARTCDKPLDDPCGCVWRDRWRARFGVLWATPELRSAAARHHVHWDPLTGATPTHDHDNRGPTAHPLLAPAPPAGTSRGHTWRALFFEFDECWQDWALAGHNRRPTIAAETTAVLASLPTAASLPVVAPGTAASVAAAATPVASAAAATVTAASAALAAAAPGTAALSLPRLQQRCLVALHGGVYDLSGFLEAHPGSPETLLDNTGCDATAFFEDVGHSRVARRLAQQLSLLPLRPAAANAAASFLTPVAGPEGNLMSSDRSVGLPFMVPAAVPAAVQFVAGAFGRFAPTAGPAASRRIVRLRSSQARLGPAARAAAAARAEAAGFTAVQSAAPPRHGPAACRACGLPKQPLTFEHPWGCPAELAAMQELCARRREHVGQCRVYFDPFTRAWACWWTCCHHWEVVAEEHTN